MSDIDPVRKRVLLLIDAGHSQRTVSEAAGIPEATVENILYRNTRVTRATFDAVMSVAVLPPWETPGVVLRPRDKVPGTGTARRVQALVWMGYSIQEIAKATGLNTARLGVMARSPHAMVQVRVAERIKAYYRQALVRTPGGVRRDRTRRWAESQGWEGPGVWDDIDRDERPVRSGDLGVLLDYIGENPGLTETNTPRLISADLGMPVVLAHKLIKEALKSGEIVKVRRGHTVRMYTSDWKEGDLNGEENEGYEVREAAVSR